MLENCLKTKKHLQILLCKCFIFSSPKVRIIEPAIQWIQGVSPAGGAVVPVIQFTPKKFVLSTLETY
jgi:hypothetical protein